MSLNVASLPEEIRFLPYLKCTFPLKSMTTVMRRAAISNFIFSLSLHLKCHIFPRFSSFHFNPRLFTPFNCGGGVVCSIL